MSHWLVNNNPTKIEFSEAFGSLEVIRMAPNDQCISIDFAYEDERASVEYHVSVVDLTNLKKTCQMSLPSHTNAFLVDNLQNGVDYRLDIKAVSNSDGKTVAVAPTRLFRTGFVPGVVVNYIHPEDYTYDCSGRSPASPSLLRIPDGKLLASHDIFWGQGGQNTTKVFVSDNNGLSWSFLSTIHPCFWGKMFIHKNILYMMGTSTEYGDLLLFSSSDWGTTWSEPITILPGGSRETGGPHQAPVPVVKCNGRIWTAIEYGSWTLGGHDAGVVSASLYSNLMNPNSWTTTPFLPYDSSWPGTICGGSPSVLEGNVVVTPVGDLVNILRYNTKGGEPDYGKAVILEIDKDNPGAPLKFNKVVDFPGNMAKFTICYNFRMEKYYSLVNRVTTDWVSQRNILTLISSPDLNNWEIERDVLNYEDNGWPEDYTSVGFQYVDWLFDDDDILALSRTAINGAYNYHNANYLTFHRFKNFAR